MVQDYLNLKTYSVLNSIMELRISIDGLGKVDEYVRHGTVLDLQNGSNGPTTKTS